MVINLEYPYSNDWKRGYLRHGKDGRGRVDLVNCEEDRTTTSYARYLLAVKLGRYLTEYEEADHIDTDRTNDSIDNLQVLTVEKHREKTSKEFSGRTMIALVCDHCGKDFEREVRNVKYQHNFCCRSCAGKFNALRSNYAFSRINRRTALGKALLV
jgi:hypothetical protein